METVVEVKLEIDEESPEKSFELLSNSGNDSSSLSRCRLCALPKNNMVDIFGLSETEDDNIVERIQYCLRIVVKETDTLPKQACRSCLEELELCYQFNKIVEEAEAQLISLEKQISGKLEVPEQKDQSVSESLERSSCTVIPEVESIALAVKTESDEPPTITQEPTVKITPLLPSLKIRYRVPVFPETLCRSTFDKNDDEYKHAESSVDDSNCVKESVPLIGVKRTDVSRPHMTRGRTRTKISILKSGRRHKEPENQAVPENTSDVTPVTKQKRDRRKEKNRYPDSNECIVCKETFKTFLEMQQHKRAHSENGDYNCSLCDKLFKNEGRMRQHMTVHNRKPWRCDYCDKECDYKSTLERHLKGCKYRPDNSERVHKCGLCPKVFRNKGHLCQHYKCHGGTGFYSCQYCGMEFTSRTERDSHRESHADERPLKCSICGWMFADSRALRLHETLHLKKKTYECSFCEKSFRLLSRMKLHMATHNTGRPWQCNYCENWFKSREVIRQHLLICKNRH